MIVKETDLMYIANLKRMINEGEFKMEGQSVVTAGLVFQWFNRLEQSWKEEVEESKKPKAPTVKKTKSKVSKPMKGKDVNNG